MTEVWKMWRLTRFLYQRQYYLSNMREILYKHDDFDNQFNKILSLNRQARIERRFLAMEYGLHVSLKRKEGEKNETDTELKKRTQSELIEDFQMVQSVITSCIENGYFQSDAENQDFIYITSTGKRFADISGLLKAWIEELGILWSLLIWLLSLAAAVISGASLSSIKTFISNSG